jgi:hypothetical protein
VAWRKGGGGGGGGGGHPVGGVHMCCAWATASWALPYACSTLCNASRARPMPPHLQRLVDHLVAIRQAVDLAVVQVLEHVMALLRARSRSAERTLGWRRRPTDGATHLERVRVGLSVRATALEVLATHEARVHVKIVASDGAGLLEICHEREGSWRGERRREACGGASNTPKSRSVRLIVSRKGQRNPSSSQGRLRRPRPLLEGTLGAAASQGWQLPPSGASAAPPLSGRGRFDAICCRARVAAGRGHPSEQGSHRQTARRRVPLNKEPDKPYKGQTNKGRLFLFPPPHH